MRFYSKLTPFAASALLTILFTACGSGAGDPLSSVPAQAPPPSSPMPVGGPYTVQGEVLSFETGMIGDAHVDLWVQQERSGYSYWWANGPLTSDELGQFQAGNLPASRISILAHKPGYVQPCAVTNDVPDMLSVRVEMLSVAALDALEPARPQLSVEPSLDGIVFEVTAAGRAPVAGARLWAEYPLFVGAATTVSDRGGRFFLCNLAEIYDLYVSKDGYEQKIVSFIDTAETPFIEIELERL